MNWIKSWFSHVVVTPEHMWTLVDDMFAMLHAGVALTPGGIDDLALIELESCINKDKLAAALAARLSHLLGV